MSAIISTVTIAVPAQDNDHTLVPPLSTSIRRVGRISRLFGTKRERSQLFRDALQRAGNFFIAHYVPLRFNRGYASNVLGYGIGGAEPFVKTGETRKKILSDAYAVARMHQGGLGPYVLLRMMAPNKVNQFPKVLAGLKTIAPREVLSIAKHFETEARLLARSAHRRTIQRGATAGRLRLSFAPPTPRAAGDTVARLARR
jgi:hypothetical protein